MNDTNKLTDSISRGAIDELPESFLQSVGHVFARFGVPTQDSGNVSYGVDVGGVRYFVKTAGNPDDPEPFFDFAGRVQALHGAIKFARTFAHTTLPALHHVIESPRGPMLVYEWRDGELLRVPAERREDPRSSFQRFRALPADDILRALDAIYDLHAQIARAGWVGVDFYDGALIYDFATTRLTVIDLDLYRPEPFRNDMGRMFGSTRFMAPEELELGAPIDQRTNLFTMGRMALVFLSDGTIGRGAFRGGDATLAVVAKACAIAREHRFESMAAFYAAWRAARAAEAGT
jgi:serine/threonine-protein kinase